MKKILSILLVALLLIGMLPMNALHTHAATAKYVKVTENLADWSGRYLIVYESGKKAMNGGLAVSAIDADNNTINVTISNNAIEATSTVTAAEFTIASDGAGKYTIQSSKNGYYLGRTGSSNGMDENATTAHKNTISYNGSNVVITSSGGPTLQAYQSGTTYRFRYYKSSQKAIALYKLEESCSHANTTTSTTEASCTVDGKTTVTCNDCGATVSETVIDALGHNYVNGVCQNCNNTLAVVSFQVPSQVEAVDSLIANENTGKVTLPKADDYTGKYAYTFAGWAEASVAETSTAPTLYTAGSEYTPEENTTLYAVYTRTEGGSGAAGYVLTDIANISPTDIVVITMTKGSTVYALPNDGGAATPDAVIVTLTDGKLTTVEDNLKWNIGGTTGAYILYPAGQTATWLYHTNSNSGVRIGKTAATFSIDSTGYLKDSNQGRYLGVYTTNPDWRCYSNTTGNTAGQTLGFFVLSAGGTTYYTSILEDEDTTCKHTNTTETTVDATCTDAGSVTVTCNACGTTVSVTEIPAKGHTEVIDQAVAPTCVKTGLTEGSHCSVCNAVIVAQQTVPATGEHTYAGGVCTVCGEKKSTKAWQLVTNVADLAAGDKIVIVAAGADFALGTNQATNNRTGIAVTKSGDTVSFGDTVQVIILQDGNVENTFAFYVEGTNTGYLYAASTSGNQLKTKSALDDNGSWLITIENGVATIKAQGSNTRNWLRYNPNNNSPIFACYASGQQDVAIYKEVILCDHENTVNVGAVAPTCTSVGYTAGKQCTDCGAYTEGHEEVAMIDHSYEGKITTAPGCTTTGEKTYTCSACGDSYTEKVEAAGHTMGDAVIVEATCTEKGSKTYTCTVCGENQVEEIKALGHNWDEGKTTLQPDCENKGEILYTCQNDNSHTKTEEIPVLGHSYVGGVCGVCGKEVSRFQLVTDYTEILAGGEYVIAAKVDGNFYALNSTADSWLKAHSVAVTGTGADMMIIYADGMPMWNVEYFLGRNNCFSLYSADKKVYLGGSESTGLTQKDEPWAWTFIDSNNEKESDGDKVFAVTQEDGSVAFVVASATVIDRAISLNATSEFKHYSVRDKRNRELYFFKLVEANQTEYTVKFVENGETTITQNVPVNENVVKMPKPVGNTLPEGYTKFVGWVELPHTESLVAPTTIFSAEEIDGANNTAAITGDKTFYALYSREDPDGEGQALSYHLVTDNNQLVIGQRYIIVGIKDGQYYAMSKDQLSGDRGGSVVTPDENGVISFLPDHNVAVFELSQGYKIGSFAFLDLAMNKFLYCASAGEENALKSQATLDEKGSFLITINANDSYSAIASQITTSTRSNIMFNTDYNGVIFSCYDPAATSIDPTQTFLYVGVPNAVYATYYTTGLCAHNWVVTEKVEATCTNAGYTLETCSICDEIRITDSQAHGHDVGASQVTTQPTCTTTGIATSTCNKCGETFDEIIPALGHTEVIDAAVAATCTTTGLTEGSHCERCGLVLVAQEETPALGHKYVGKVAPNAENVPVLTYTCENCSDSYSIELRFVSANLSLQNSLIIGFMTNTDVVGADGFTNVYATFQYGMREEMKVTLSEATLNGGQYRFPCRYITPSQIGDTVYATLYGTYNGVEYSYRMEYGVSRYCYNMLSKETTAENLKPLLVDMLYYCDAARVYTGYKPNEPVTTELTEEQKTYTSADRDYNYVLNAKLVTVENPLATWKAASLVMYHSTRMQMRFAIAEGVDIATITAKVMVGDEEKTGHIIEAAGYPGQYMVVIDDIAARQLSDNVDVTLYVGNTVISNTIRYSVESYAYAKRNDSNVKLVNLVKALMHYGDSAREFLG